MKQRAIVLLTLICIAAGTIFFLIQKNWLIIHLTFTPSHLAQTTLRQQTVLPKLLKVYYSKHEKWHQEEASIIWNENNALFNLEQVVKQWLKVLHDEHLIPSNISLENTILTSPGSEAFLSFNHALFAPEWSIMRKWQLIESLFKTIHQASFHISNISLLAHNKPMLDDHLDFSKPLPVLERL